MSTPARLVILLGCLALAACGDASRGDLVADATADTTPGTPDAPGTVSCLAAGHVAGERYVQPDGCNFCTCTADGTSTCSDRACQTLPDYCTYQGAGHAYAERFPTADACNECVCATSGLACTEREGCAPIGEDHAILMESLNEPCGDAAFTGQAVLDELPQTDFTAPFPYQHNREKYPETLPDTTATFRVRYSGGYAVCRIPSAGQEAIDLEASAELVTADGSFDEGLHSYLRKDRTGFVDAWYTVGSIPPGTLTGTHDPNCIDFLGHTISAQIDRDGSAFGSAFKTCETDFFLEVGTWSTPAPTPAH